MSSLSDFKKDFRYIADRYYIKKVTWTQFIPLDEEVVYEINIISIDDKPFSKLDKLSKLAWESFFKLTSNYSFKFLSQQFGNNVEVTISKDEMIVNEYVSF